MRKKISKINKDGWNNYLFLMMICLVFLFGMYGLVKTPQKASNSENRNLTQFSHFTIKNFLNGKFQDNFENALSDQFIFSEKIRNMYGATIAHLPDFGLKDVVCRDHYMSVVNDTNNSIRTFDCGDYLVRVPKKPTAKKLAILKENISKFNHVNSLKDSYYYIMNTSATFDFEKNQKMVDYEQVLSDEMEGNFNISSLGYDNYEQYKEYFYKTDHHWNYKGSYQGFLDIAEMLGIKNPMKPIRTFTNHEYFFGTMAKALRRYEDLEEFTIYEFAFPEHDIFVNGVPKTKYSHIDDFITHNYEYSQAYTFYQGVYGTSRGEIVFDFHQPKKQNLLIFCDSFGHPLKELIAQYYNKTYVVDLRHYEDSMKKPFVFSDYIKENKIDKVLFIASSEYFLLESDTTRGLEL